MPRERVRSLSSLSLGTALFLYHVMHFDSNVHLDNIFREVQVFHV